VWNVARRVKLQRANNEFKRTNRRLGDENRPLRREVRRLGGDGEAVVGEAGSSEDGNEERRRRGSSRVLQASAFVALLSGGCRLSKRTIKGLFLDAFGLDVSVGSVINSERAVSEALAQPVEEAHAHAQQQAAA
jgi:hypothetical protein